MSARAHDKVLRIARTIADLEGSADIVLAVALDRLRHRRAA